jgi:hypothetical protein
MVVVNNGYKGCSQMQQTSNKLISGDYFRLFLLFSFQTVADFIG